MKPWVRRAARQVAAGLALLCASPVAAQQMLPGKPLERHVVRDHLDRSITYYANRPTRRAPILLMIQGSGCGGFLKPGGGSTLFDLLPFAAEGKFKVVAVEKPFSDPAKEGGTASNCGNAFNADFTADRWLVAIRAALDDARRLPDVDPSRTIVLGVSEGAVMASLLAGRDPRITDAIVIGGSGTTQLFDFIVSGYQCFDRPACLTDVETQARAIAADPTSTTRFVWGHPFLRWSSFFKVDPGEELLRSHARIYLAFGTADASVPALSQEVAVAKLLAAGRDLTVRRVPDAGHDLLPRGAINYDALDVEYRRALAWVDATGR